MIRPDAIIIGAGISGMACALALAHHGIRPLVLETRKKLGGRATSFTDVRSGEVLDNCQHVALGCCTNYLAFLRALGTEDQISWHDDQYWFEPGGRQSNITCAGLGRYMPPPGHYSLSLLAAKFLTTAEKIILSKGVLDVLAADRSQFRDRTFTAFLQSSDQTPRLISRFWEPVVVSACNLSCDKVAASSALHVFQEGFLAHRQSARIGIPCVPLLELYTNFESSLNAVGGQLALGTSVSSITPTTVTLSRTGETLRADHVICATPFEAALQLADPATKLIDPRFAAMARFTHSPIFGVHLTFDRPVLRTPHAVLVDQATQWLFAKPVQNGDNNEHQTISAVISAADAWLDHSEHQIAEHVVADIVCCMPWAASAQLISARAVKEKRATFAPNVSTENSRPAATLGPGSLILAGDYTDTGWPSTMEGAVRSGLIAAAAVLGLPAATLLQKPLPVAPAARMLGLGMPSASTSPGYAATSAF